MKNNKIYYIKICQDFFEKDEIIFMENTDNGDKKICIYLNMLESTIKTKGRIYLINGEYTMSNFIKNMERWNGISFADIEDTIKTLLKLEIISINDNRYIQINDYYRMLDYELIEDEV